MAVVFHIEGNPISKERPRLNFKKKNQRAYTPPRTRKWEKSIREQAIKSRQIEEIYPKTVNLGSVITLRRADRRAVDMDNLLKCVWDALNKVVYQDDSQIMAILARLIRKDPNPGIDVAFMPIEEWLEALHPLLNHQHDFPCQFTVDGNPQPKQRPRLMAGKNGGSYTYTPDGTEEWESTITKTAHLHQVQPQSGELLAFLQFHRSNRIRVDIDNLMKCVWDALNNVAYDDDAQITLVCAIMHQASATPGVSIGVAPVNQWYDNSNPIFDFYTLKSVL